MQRRGQVLAVSCIVSVFPNVVVRPERESFGWASFT